MVRAAYVAALALVVAACEQPVPPAVAQRKPSLDAEDVAVVKALLDDLIRPGRPPGARLLVVDKTMAMCRRDPARLGPEAGRCLIPDHAKLVSQIVPGQMSAAVTLNFPNWNVAALRIPAQLGDDVISVSPTLVDMMAPSELLRRYPPGSDVVMLSAPGYPAPRMAVIFFGTSRPGVARLELQPDGRWRVAAHAMPPVD